MKVNAAGGFFRGYGTSGLKEKNIGVSSPLAGGRAKSDQVTLSKQVFAVVQMQNRLKAIAQAKEDAQNSPEAQALDSMRKMMEIQKACNKIAARIRAGDRVPLKDLRYLIKHDIRAYQMAMASRKPNDDPKEWDSAIPKEDQEREQPTELSIGGTDQVQATSGCEGLSGSSASGAAGSESSDGGM